MKKLILILAAVIACTTAWCQPQPDYIPDQLGRDAHHIIQSLGAFVGNERAESQQFDITYMPSGNDVGGVMIINTADYRCTFQFDASTDICTELTIDIRSQVFLDQFYNLFAVYRTESFDNYRIMSFGNVKLRIVENPSTSTRYRSFKFTIE